MIEFLLIWLAMFCLIILTMIHDNFWWMPTSPEWPKVKTMGFGEYLGYVWKDRVVPVCTSFRDLLPAFFSSLSLTLILFGNWIWGLGLLLGCMVATINWVKHNG